MTSSDASGRGGSKARCGRPQQSFRGDAQHRAIVPMLTDDSLGVIPGRPNGGGCLPINSTKINGSLIRSSGCHSQNLTLSASGQTRPPRLPPWRAHTRRVFPSKRTHRATGSGRPWARSRHPLGRLPTKHGPRPSCGAYAMKTILAASAQSQGSIQGHESAASIPETIALP